MGQDSQFANRLNLDLSNPLFRYLKLVGNLVGLKTVTIHSEAEGHNLLFAFVEFRENSLQFFDYRIFQRFVLRIVFALISDQATKRSAHSVTNRIVERKHFLGGSDDGAQLSLRHSHHVGQLIQ